MHVVATTASAVMGRLDGVMIARLALAVILCGAVGLERSTHERASGLRTHIMVGLGACLMTMAGGYGFQDLRGSGTGDPMRVASYVVSGIGFLGAGAILRHGTTLRGLTTAASLWSVAGVGIAIGVGMGWLAAVAAVLMLFTLAPLQKWEYRLRFGEGAGDISIHLTNDTDAVGKVLAFLGRSGVSVNQATITPGAGETAMVRLELGRAIRADQVAPLLQRLLLLKYVSRVDATDLNIDRSTAKVEFGGVQMVDRDQEETPDRTSDR